MSLRQKHLGRWRHQNDLLASLGVQPVRARAVERDDERGHVLVLLGLTEAVETIDVPTEAGTLLAVRVSQANLDLIGKRPLQFPPRVAAFVVVTDDRDGHGDVGDLLPPVAEHSATEREVVDCIVGRCPPQACRTSEQDEAGVAAGAERRQLDRLTGSVQ